MNRWQRIWQTTLHRTCEIFSLSLVCWAATLPILILQEHHVSLVAVFANLIVVPLATAVMVLGVTAMLLSGLSGWIAACFNNTNWLIAKTILIVLHGANSIPCQSLNVSIPSMMLPDRVTALCERSGHVIHVHLKGQDRLINTGKLAQWRAITQPYLQSQGVNRLHDLIFCGATHGKPSTTQRTSSMWTTFSPRRQFSFAWAISGF